MINNLCLGPNTILIESLLFMKNGIANWISELASASYPPLGQESVLSVVSVVSRIEYFLVNRPRGALLEVPQSVGFAKILRRSLRLVLQSFVRELLESASTRVGLPYLWGINMLG